MSRRATVLDALEPEATVALAPHALRRLGIEPGATVRVTTRRGAVQGAARADPGLPEDMVFLAFAFREAAANMLTDPRLDPQAKIPGFKYCAARVEAV